jgi:hypothetical protein
MNERSTHDTFQAHDLPIPQAVFETNGWLHADLGPVDTCLDSLLSFQADLAQRTGTRPQVWLQAPRCTLRFTTTGVWHSSPRCRRLLFTLFTGVITLVLAWLVLRLAPLVTSTLSPFRGHWAAPLAQASYQTSLAWIRVLCHLLPQACVPP